MKKLLIIGLLFCIFYSCDPISNMEADIENLTSQRLVLDFIAFDDNFNKTLEINPDETLLFQDAFDVGGTFLQPHLTHFDSVVIRNSTYEILKVYKEFDPGKNIYNIDDYWIATLPRKRFYKYKYQIESNDLN